jgi:hypothetical protein
LAIDEELSARQTMKYTKRFGEEKIRKKEMRGIMQRRVPWLSAVAYFMQNWDLKPVLIRDTDQEIFYVHGR